jgi:hypothetical protein
MCEKVVHRGVSIGMKVFVGSLARSGLETRVGPNLPAAVNTALVYYVGKLNSGRRPAPVPKFLISDETKPKVEVEVDERIEAALFTDAERQGVDPSDLATHAVLVYLGELDRVGDPDAGRSPRGRLVSGAARKANRSAH